MSRAFGLGFAVSAGKLRSLLSLRNSERSKGLNRHGCMSNNANRTVPFTASKELYSEGMISGTEYALELYKDGIMTGGEALEFAVKLEKEQAALIQAVYLRSL